MAKPMIENSDRGITLNKGLAWTMLVAIVTAVFWGGRTVQGLVSSNEAITAAVQEQKASIAVVAASQNESQGEARRERSGLDSRIRTLESGQARGAAQYDSLSRSLDELKQSQREANELLRQLMRGAAR